MLFAIVGIAQLWVVGYALTSHVLQYTTTASTATMCMCMSSINMLNNNFIVDNLDILWVITVVTLLIPHFKGVVIFMFCVWIGNEVLSPCSGPYWRRWDLCDLFHLNLCWKEIDEVIFVTYFIFALLRGDILRGDIYGVIFVTYSIFALLF